MTTLLTTAPSVAALCRSRRSAVLFLTSLTLLGAAAAAPKHAVAQVPCARWDLSQGWTAVQSNGFSAGFTLQQSGPTLEGSGVVTPPNVSWFSTGPFTTLTEGPVTGTTNGDSIQLTTNWGGVYTGRIDFSGRIDGLTYDKRDSTSSARWYSDRRMNCLVSAGSTVPPVSTPPASRQPILVPDGTTGVLTSGRGAASAGVFGGAPAAAPAPASSPAPSPAPTPVLTGPHQIPIEGGRIIGRLLSQTNQYRSTHGVRQLEASAALTHAAQQYAEFLARTNTSGHSADGRSIKQRIVATNEYQPCFYAENVFETESVPAISVGERAMESWRTAAGQDANLRNARAKQFGVGVAAWTHSGRDYYKVVQVFGAECRVVAPKLLAPSVVSTVSSGTVLSGRGSAGATAIHAALAACKPGFVPRAARPTDVVCVTPDSHARVVEENRTAASRVGREHGGAYGRNTCRSGFVWRDAFDGDGVCVAPSIRDLVHAENRLAAARTYK